MRAQHRQKLKKTRRQDIAPARKCVFETGLHQRELAPVVIQKPAKPLGVVRRDGPDLPFHFLPLGRAIEGSALAEDEAVLRIEPNEFYLSGEGGAGGPQNLIEHAWIEKKRSDRDQT